jgi:fermentation-respiration switch protein FrsA (DUF1100 family)
VDTAEPGQRLSRLLTNRGAALYPQTLRTCQAGLVQADSFGGLAPADVLRSDADLSPLVKALARRDDVENVRIRTPVRVEQGTDDQTVFPFLTDDLVTAFKARKNPVVYVKYDGVSHGGIVDAADADALKFLRRRF